MIQISRLQSWNDSTQSDVSWTALFRDFDFQPECEDTERCSRLVACCRIWCCVVRSRGMLLCINRLYSISDTGMSLLEEDIKQNIIDIEWILQPLHCTNSIMKTSIFCSSLITLMASSDVSGFAPSKSVSSGTTTQIAAINDAESRRKFLSNSFATYSAAALASTGVLAPLPANAASAQDKVNAKLRA